MLINLRRIKDIRTHQHQDSNTVFHGMITTSLIHGLKVLQRTVNSSQMLKKKINAGVILVHLKSVVFSKLKVLIIWLSNIQIFLHQELQQVFHGLEINSLMITMTSKTKVLINSKVEESVTSV